MGGEGEGGVLVVVATQEVVLVPGPVRGHQDVVIVTSVTGLGPEHHTVQRLTQDLTDSHLTSLQVKEIRPFPLDLSHQVHLISAG